MLVVEDVERRAPTWNLTLFTSEDHMSSSTWKSCQVSANLWGPLWPYLTEKTPDGRKREFYGTMGRLHSSNLGPTGEHWDRAPHRGVLANVDSRFENIPSVYFQLRWFLGAWQRSSSGGGEGWRRENPRAPHLPTIESLEVSIKIPDTRTKVIHRLPFRNDNLVNIWI